MFSLAASSVFYRYAGLVNLLLQLSCYVWTFPPFQTGIWLQSEPVVFSLFITAALSGLWLALGLWRGWLKPPAACHPLWMCLMAWIGWQVFTTCFAASPWRSWFGPPQTGDGTAMAIATLLTCMVAYPLWEVKRHRHIIMAVAGMGLFLQCLLHAIYPHTEDNIFIPGRWVPAQWPEYLPFVAAYLWLAAFAGRYIKNTVTYALIVASMIAVLMVSYNKSAVAFFLPALLLISCLRCLPRRAGRLSTTGPSWRRLAMACCAAPLLMVAISPALPSIPARLDPTGTVGLLTRINDGIGTRMVLNQVALATLAHEPSRLLIGAGWGTFTDDLFKYALVNGTYTYKDGQRAPNWFLVDGSSHHSHNQPLEALLSLGIPGMVLWYALPMVALWYLPRRYFWSCAPMLIGLIALDHVWFPLPQCFPYRGLYWLALLVMCAKRDYAPSATSLKSILLCALATVAMTLSAYGQFKAMMHAERVHNAIFLEPYSSYSEEWLAEDLRYGGDRWAASVRFYTNDASGKAAKRQIDDNMVGWYTYFMHNAHLAALNPAIGARAASMELHMAYYLFGGFDDPRFDPLRHEATENFEDAVMRMTYKAPLRDDYTTFFLLNLAGFTHDDIPRQIQILTRMRSIAPQHRGVLWVLGHILQATPGRESEGEAMVRKAVALHVEDVYPLTQAQLAPYKKQGSY